VNHAEVDKASLKSNSDEALSVKSLLKRSGNKALNDDSH
jgi:hypothetical protein